MGEKRDHLPPNTPTRGGLRTAESTPAWNVCPQIVVEHWDGFQRGYPREDQRSSAGLVDKRRGGGNPDKRGSIASRCRPGGEGTPRVARRCPSSLGLRCATVYGDPGGSPVREMLPEGVISRHSVLTVPALGRQTFARQSPAFLRPFQRGGGRCVEAVVRRVSGTNRQGGSLVVIQPPGRHGQDHPPRHLIATSGGGDQQARPGGHLDSIPYPLLRKTGPWSLLTRRRQPVQTQEITR